MNQRRRRPFEWGPRHLPLAGFLTGLLLMLPGVLPVAAPVQAVAFVPLLIALPRVKRWRECLHIGLLMGLGFVAPQILLLQLPPLISLILVLYFVVVLVVLVVVAWRLVCPVDFWGCLAFGALLALVDWGTVTALPMWGTAQSLARCWSAYPRAIAFTAVTGMAGIMFVLGAAQALAVLAVGQKRRWASCLLALLVVGIAVGVMDLAALRPEPERYLKVAAVGWKFDPEHGDPGNASGFAKLYAEPVEAAASQGARLIVSPETAFAIYDDSEHDPFDKFVELARTHGVYLAVGYMDIRSGENRVAFLGPDGTVLGRYTKTHLTPFESSPKGDGQPVLVTIDGVSVGVMICHDDNYTDISRRYGQEATGIVVVPTNDWRQVRAAHFQSTIHRAIESRFAIVRATSNGISAIISPDGVVLDVCDHFREGPGLVMAEVPVYRTETFFSRLGHWFVPVCLICLAAQAVWRTTNERSVARSATS